MIIIGIRTLSMILSITVTSEATPSIITLCIMTLKFPAGKLKAFLIHSVSQSVCMRDYYINVIILSIILMTVTILNAVKFNVIY